MGHKQLRFITIIVLLEIFFPAQLTAVDYRGLGAEIRLGVNRRSPAYYALEEVKAELEEEGTDAAAQRSAEPMVLNAGKAVQVKMEPKVVEALKGMIISEAGPSHQRLPGVKEPKLYGGDGELLSIEERKLALVDYYSQFDYSTPSVGSRAQELVQAEQESGREKDQKVLVFIPTEGSKGPPQAVTLGKDAKKPAAPTRRDQAGTQTQASDGKTSHIAAAGNFSGITNQLRDLLTGKRFLKGHILMGGGLAYVSDEQELTVFRRLNHKDLEKAQVWPADGRFEMEPEAMEGELIGQLIDEQGIIKGEGRLDLASLYSQKQSEELSLKILPTRGLGSVQVISARSFDGYKFPVSKAEVSLVPGERPEGTDAEGRIGLSGISSQSAFIIRAMKADYWPTVSWVSANRQNQIKMTPDGMAQALVQIVLGRDKERMRAQGIVWGQVTNEGRPLKYAEVEIAHADSSLGAIYFNDYIPDSRLHTTTENGLFAFVGVAPGINAIRVKHEGQYFPAEIVIVEPQSITALEIHPPLQRQIRAFSTNIITGELTPRAFIRPLGTEEVQEYPVDGRPFDLALPGDNGAPWFVDVDAGEDFEISRVNVSRRAGHLRLALVEKAWLQGLLVQARANLDSTHGIVVGRMGAEKLKVDMSQESLKQAGIIYFDSSGKLSRTEDLSNYGGFIIYGVPLGAQTLVLNSRTQRQIHAQTIVVEPEVINVMNLIETHP